VAKQLAELGGSDDEVDFDMFDENPEDDIDFGDGDGGETVSISIS
jgi:hypothetical protein